MFTLATLILICLLSGIYFTISKHINKLKERKADRQEQINTRYREYYKAVKENQSECKEVQPKIVKHFRRKVILKSKYNKRFV